MGDESILFHGCFLFLCITDNMAYNCKINIQYDALYKNVTMLRCSLMCSVHAQLSCTAVSLFLVEPLEGTASIVRI